MQIIGARQQIHVSQQQTQYQGRFTAQSAQQLVQQTSQTTDLSTVTAPRTAFPSTQPTSPAKQRLPQMPTQAPAMEAPVKESTPETKENEDDCKQFSALHTIGQVKKILEQLVSGKLSAWLVSDHMELPTNCPSQDQAVKASDGEAPSRQTPPSDQVLVNYRYQQLTAAFSGEVSLQDGSNIRWDFQFAQVESQYSFVMQRAEDVKDPLIVSLDGSFRATGQWMNFAMTEQTQGRLDKLSAAQYYLVHDKNHNGKADSGSELFGPNSGQGFAELGQLDSDGNGFIDAADPQFAELYLWQPNRSLQSLADLNIGALSVTSAATSFDYYQQDQLQARLSRSGIAITNDKQVALIQQVDFTV